METFFIGTEAIRNSLSAALTPQNGLTVLGNRNAQRPELTFYKDHIWDRGGFCQLDKSGSVGLTFGWKPPAGRQGFLNRIKLGNATECILLFNSSTRGKTSAQSGYSDALVMERSVMRLEFLKP